MSKQVILVQHYEDTAHAYEVHGQLYSKGYEHAFSLDHTPFICASKEDIPEDHRHLFENAELNKEPLQELGYDVIPYDEYWPAADMRYPF